MSFLNIRYKEVSLKIMICVGCIIYSRHRRCKNDNKSYTNAVFIRMVSLGNKNDYRIEICNPCYGVEDALSSCA